MRKIYIIQEVVEDDRVLDTLLARGIDPDQLENPRCPLCNADTLLAYAEGDEYQVITWDCLSDEEMRMRPDAWYLICQEYECRYEEQVEHVSSPGDAEIFDLLDASFVFDEESGLTSTPTNLKELIAYLESVRKSNPHRKIEVFLEEARWQYKDGMARVRAWVKQIPPARRIHFYLGADKVEGRLVAATEDSLLVQREPDGEMLAVNVDAISFYGPQRFDSEEDPPGVGIRRMDPDSWVRCKGSNEYVVVQGYHLQLCEVDRFGQYHVYSRDPQAAAAIGLEEVGEGCWRGRLRRRGIEARYEKRQMVKVKGFWVKRSGETARSHSPYVHTEDAVVAAALGLKQVIPSWTDEEIGEPGPQIPRWSGVIPRNQVEEWDEVTVYQWPIPELKEPG